MFILNNPVNPVQMSMTILRTVNVSKAYDGVQALRNVPFDLHAGEVHALVGENGAGKSTLIKIITGAVTPDSGHLEFDGVAVKTNSPAIAKTFGMPIRISKTARIRLS